MYPRCCRLAVVILACSGLSLGLGCTGCAGCPPTEVEIDECITELESAYTIDGSVQGTDGCPAQSVELEFQLVRADGTVLSETPTVATDSDGQFRAQVRFAPLGHFARCMTPDQVLAVVSPEALAPPLQRVDITMQATSEGPPVAVSVPVDERSLEQFRPWDDNLLDLGTFVLVGVHMCE